MNIPNKIDFSKPENIIVYGRSVHCNTTLVKNIIREIQETDNPVDIFILYSQSSEDKGYDNIISKDNQFDTYNDAFIGELLASQKTLADQPHICVIFDEFFSQLQIDYFLIMATTFRHLNITLIYATTILDVIKPIHRANLTMGFISDNDEIENVYTRFVIGKIQRNTYDNFMRLVKMGHNRFLYINSFTFQSHVSIAEFGMFHN